MSKDRAAKIKLLLFDVDGVLTDGKIWVLPAPAGSRQSTKEDDAKQLERGGFGLASGEYLEATGFNARDGTAISLARLGGIKTGLITKRISETVALRARDLRVDHVCQGILDKFAVFQQGGLRPNSCGKRKVFPLGLTPSVEMTEIKVNREGLLRIAPPIAFAWGVLGSAIGGYFSPYSPCCFQEYLDQFNPRDGKSLAPLQTFYNFFQTADFG